MWEQPGRQDSSQRVARSMFMRGLRRPPAFGGRGVLGLAAARGSAALRHTPQAADPARLRGGETARAPAAGAHIRATHQAAIMILRGIAGSVVPELHPPRAQAQRPPRASRGPHATPRPRCAIGRRSGGRLPPTCRRRTARDPATATPRPRRSAGRQHKPKAPPSSIAGRLPACPHAMAHCMRYTRQTSAVRPSLRTARQRARAHALVWQYNGLKVQI